MCGIGGIMYKLSSPGSLATVGEDLVKMLEAMKHRGLDSSGVTIAGEELEEDYLIRVWADPESDYEDRFQQVEEKVTESGGVVRTRGSIGEYLRLGVNYEGGVDVLADALVNIDGVEIHSLGERSEVIKDVGSGVDLDEKHKVSSFKGTHGIGHVRMATESRVDITHAHPFWAYPFPDVTVVHNGQLTNYHKLKRAYEDQGHRFQTENDSELIAVYLADRLAKGASLQQALEASLDDLDGTFTYLVSTKDGLGAAKDQWAAKPLVLMETKEMISLASEEVALRTIFPDEIERVEPQEKEVMTWLI